MNKIGIYKITNPKGKVYIGQSINIDQRIWMYKKGYCKKQPLLFNSLNKYGFDNHVLSILLICKIEELNKYERLYIKKFKSNNKQFGLNLTCGGQDYWHHNEETLKKMSLAQRGNKKTLGRIQSQEEINKRVEKLKGKKRTEAQKAKMSASHKGVLFSDERKRKMSITSKGKNSKKVIDLNTGIIFNSCIDAANYFNIKKTTLIAKLNGQNPNNTSLRYE